MAKPWFPFYFADYAAKTEHLSLAEHGAYLLLMGCYYKRGGKIPANEKQLLRICRAFTTEEAEAMASVLSQFFVKKGEYYHHERINQEIKKQKELSKKRSESGRKGGKAKSLKVVASA